MYTWGCSQHGWSSLETAAVDSASPSNKLGAVPEVPLVPHYAGLQEILEGSGTDELRMRPGCLQVEVCLC